MSDAAIEGTQGAYVPCFELPAPLDVEEEGAISGIATGFVAARQEAAALPIQEREAIVGSDVGFVAGPCCPWVWQNGSGDGAVGSGRWTIGGGCLLSLDVEGDAGTGADDMVIFELPEIAETADAYASIRAGVTLSAEIYVPFISANLNPPSLEESGHGIDVFARDDPNTVTTRISAAFRLFAYGSGDGINNGLIHLTMFGKQRQTHFPASPGFHTLSLTITPTSTTAMLDGHIANLNTSITPPNLAPPVVDMSSLAEHRIRMGENDMGAPSGIFTAQPSLP